MPSHTHTISVSSVGTHTHSYFNNNGNGGQSSTDGKGAWGAWKNTGEAGSHSHTAYASSAGSTRAHENMPPYETIHRWKRTA